MSPWIWAVGALVVALLELHAPGCYLIWIALGGAVTAIAAFAGVAGLPTQLAVFAAASLVSCAVGYFVYKRVMAAARAEEAPINQRERAMIGMKGTVEVAFSNGRGKVRLGDSLWLAEGADLPAGTEVVVKSVRGTTAIVEAAG
jgi:hypothetical protein